jgi:hypothetical protein
VISFHQSVVTKANAYLKTLLLAELILQMMIHTHVSANSRFSLLAGGSKHSYTPGSRALTPAQRQFLELIQMRLLQARGLEGFAAIDSAAGISRKVTIDQPRLVSDPASKLNKSELTFSLHTYFSSRSLDPQLYPRGQSADYRLTREDPSTSWRLEEVSFHYLRTMRIHRSHGQRAWSQVPLPAQNPVKLRREGEHFQIHFFYNGNLSWVFKQFPHSPEHKTSTLYPSSPEAKIIWVTIDEYPAMNEKSRSFENLFGRLTVFEKSQSGEISVITSQLEIDVSTGQGILIPRNSFRRPVSEDAQAFFNLLST